MVVVPVTCTLVAAAGILCLIIFLAHRNCTNVPLMSNVSNDGSGSRFQLQSDQNCKYQNCSRTLFEFFPIDFYTFVFCSKNVLDSTESTRKCENLTMSSFSPKNEAMIDCYQINYATCHQLDGGGGPKVSNHCSINDGGQRCAAPIFGPGSSFRVITDVPRSGGGGDHNHVYDMPHRRGGAGGQIGHRLDQVSDDCDDVPVGPILVTLVDSSMSMSHVGGGGHIFQESFDRRTDVSTPPPELTCMYQQ